MLQKKLHLRSLFGLSALLTLFWLGTAVRTQSAAAQGRDAAEPAQDNDATRTELARFDQFLDNHPEIAEQLHKDPSLVNNPGFVKDHPVLRDYLQDHPRIREEIRENPNAFMRQEDRFDRAANGRDDDRNLVERDRFDQFLDSHHEIAEQIRKNPSLLNDKDFVKNHPALQAYLRDHPETREEARENSDEFMRREDRLDRMQNGDRDMAREREDNFREFLAGHPDVAGKLSHDPTLAKNQEFMENHPEFRDYLKDHPEVNQELMDNPQGFVKSAQPFNNQGANTPAHTPGANPHP